VTKTIAFLTLWRDNEKILDRSLSQLETMEDELIPKGYRFTYAFLENDSKDETAMRLYKWLRERRGFLISEQIDAPKWGSVALTERTRWLARYRNVCLAALDFWKYDYLVVADSDVHFKPDLLTQMVDHLDQNPDWGMITPNTVQNVADHVGETDLPSYFDSWTLIDKQQMQGMTFAANPFLSSHDREDWEKGHPISVYSAFGSIAMIRGEIPQEYEVHWSAEVGCEHTGLCEDITKIGYEIIVDPKLHAEIIHDEPVIPDPAVVKMHQDRLKLAEASTLLE